MSPSEDGVIGQVKRTFIMEMSHGVHVIARDSQPLHGIVDRPYATDV